MDTSSATWRKSTRSQSNGQCVEIADNLPRTVAMRDSKHPTGPTLAFTSAQWRAFIAATRNGDFDR